tara:strand:+ start:8200 stop:9240 length:1041 start_codon:yes stop_codon:yes gene_type:complete
LFIVAKEKEVMGEMEPANFRRRREDNDGKCRNCGCENLMEDLRRGEIVCRECGQVDRDGVIADDGAEISRGEGSQNSPTKTLGSDFIKGREKTARRLERARKQAARERSTFLQETESLVDSAVEGERTKTDVKHLLRDLGNEKGETAIGDIRKKRHGQTGMSDGEKRAYKQRLFVAGAMKALNDSRRPNEAPQIAERWGINHADLMDVAKVFKKVLSKNDCVEVVDLDAWMKERAFQLLYNLEKIREFLAVRAGWERATEAMEQAMDILEGQNEPLPPDNGCDKMIVGNYCNMIAHRAAWESFVAAMKKLGYADAEIRALRTSLPLSSTKSFTERRSKALSDGEEE